MSQETFPPIPDNICLSIGLLIFPSSFHVLSLQQIVFSWGGRSGDLMGHHNFYTALGPFYALSHLIFLLTLRLLG